MQWLWWCMRRGARTALPAVREIIPNIGIHFETTIMMLRIVLSLAAALVLQTPALAHEYRLGDLRIDHPSARPTVPGQRSGAAYLTLENQGKSADRLLAASSPLAKSVQIHSMKMEGDVMKMREADGVVLPPAAKVTMQSGDGYHIMLLGLSKPLKTGDRFPLTLTFEKAGKLEVSVAVENVVADKKIDSPASRHARH